MNFIRLRYSSPNEMISGSPFLGVPFFMGEIRLVRSSRLQQFIRCVCRNGQRAIRTRGGSGGQPLAMILVGIVMGGDA